MADRVITRKWAFFPETKSALGCFALHSSVFVTASPSRDKNLRSHLQLFPLLRGRFPLLSLPRQGRIMRRNVALNQTATPLSRPDANARDISFAFSYLHEVFVFPPLRTLFCFCDSFSTQNSTPQRTSVPSAPKIWRPKSHSWSRD